jgi:hypothetical protein
MRENMQAKGGHGLQEGETADLQIRQSAG